MKRLTANLKIFYQRPILYFWYIVILAQVPVLVGSNSSKMQNMEMFHLIMSLLFGLLVGSMQKEIMCRPIAYCLPGYRKFSHKFIFLFGALLTLIPVAFQFKMMTATADNFLLTTAAVWLIGMTAYLLSIWLTFQPEYSDNRPCLIGGLWAVFFIAIWFTRNHRIWIIFAKMPLIIILPTLAWVVFFWFYLGKKSHRRNCCGQKVSTIFDRWDMNKVRARRTARVLEKAKHRTKISAIAGRFLTGKMKNCSEWKNRSALGFIYTSFDSMLLTSISAGRPVFLLLLVIGYMFGTIIADGPKEPHVMFDMFYILPIVGAMTHLFPSHPTLHIPANRKEKFYASFVNGIFVVIFAMVFVGAGVGLANILQPYMPKIPGHIFNPSPNELSFAAPRLSNIYIIPMLMPLGFTASVLLGSSRIRMMIFGPIIFIACFGLRLVQVAHYWNWIIIPAAFAVSWLGFIAVLRWHCMKRNLV